MKIEMLEYKLYTFLQIKPFLTGEEFRVVICSRTMAYLSMFLPPPPLV